MALPARVRDVLIFGGSFDPPHVYHTTAPRQALQSLLPERSWLLYVPAASSPLKGRGPVASDAHRLAMLRLALGDGPCPCSIWTDELDRAARGAPSPSYTIDTLERLARVLGPRVRLHLLIGADQALQFHRWKRARAILRAAPPWVLPRPAGEGDRPAIETAAQLEVALRETGAWSPAEQRWWGKRVVKMPSVPVSSTRVRDALQQGNGAALGDAIAPAVRAYIHSHRLYAAHPAPPRA